MSTPTGIAAIYTRISRDATGDGDGVKRQEKLCRALAARLGLTVLEPVYSDNDIGASETTGDKERPSYRQLWEDAEARKFTHILAYSNSRLTRRLRELEDLIRLHDRMGLTIHTVSAGQDDLSTTDGRMVARIKASVDAAESERISERQRATFLDNRMAGKPKLQRQRPFGWEDDGVTLRHDEAELIREAVQKIKAGASLASIRDQWQAAGVLTAAGNANWEHTVLKRVLVGWRTAGVRTYQRQPVEDAQGVIVMGLWEPIISLEDRTQALAMLERRAHQKKRQGKWLLSGMVRCGRCGGHMYGQLTATPTYSCKQGGGHLAITADKLETHVQGMLLTRLALRMGQGQTADQAKKVGDWPHADRLATVVRKAAEIMDAYNADRLPGEVAFAQVDKLANERRSLERDREEHYAQTVRAESPMRRASELLEWAQDMMAGAERREPGDDTMLLLLRQEIGSINIKPGNRGRAGWGDAAFEARVEIDWQRD